jgi:hypothetical protein
MLDPDSGSGTGIHESGSGMLPQTLFLLGEMYRIHTVFIESGCGRRLFGDLIQALVTKNLVYIYGTVSVTHTVHTVRETVVKTKISFSTGYCVFLFSLLLIVLLAIHRVGTSGTITLSIMYSPFSHC